VTHSLLNLIIKFAKIAATMSFCFLAVLGTVFTSVREEERLDQWFADGCHLAH